MEYEFVTAHASTACFQRFEREPVGSQQTQDGFGLCDLEWVSTEPIDHIVPQRHPPLERAPARQSAYQPPGPVLSKGEARAGLDVLRVLK